MSLANEKRNGGYKKMVVGVAKIDVYGCFQK